MAWINTTYVENVYRVFHAAAFEGRASLPHYILGFGVGIWLATVCFQQRRALAERVIVMQPDDRASVESFLASKNFFRDSQFAGKSTIYLNPHKPHVLIKVPALGHSLEHRLAQVNLCRQFCREKGFQKLVIPLVAHKGYYLKEERLPIFQLSDFEQIELYLTHRKSFTEAIQEFARFLCLSRFEDLLSFRDLSCFIDRQYLPRRDNAPLYLEGGIGKIGLIDLEHWNKSDQNPSAYQVETGCSTAIRFFPYHFKEILAVALEFDSRFEKNDELQLRKREAETFFEHAYLRYESFLKEQNITPENPGKMVEMTDDKKGEILARLSQKMDRALWDNSKLDLLQEAIFPLVFERVYAFHCKRFDYLVTKKVPAQVNSFGLVMALRTHRINRQWVHGEKDHDPFEKMLFTLLEEDLDRLSIFSTKEQRHRFIDWATREVYAGFADLKLIGSFHPSVYGDSDLIQF